MATLSEVKLHWDIKCSSFHHRPPTGLSANPGKKYDFGYPKV